MKIVPHHLRGSGYREKFYQGESRSAADQPCLCSRCYRSACHAELKAMDELEEMMRAESDCASCACAEECADTSVYQDAFDDAPKAAEPAAEEPQAEAEEEPEAEED